MEDLVTVKNVETNLVMWMGSSLLLIWMEGVLVWGGQRKRRTCEETKRKIEEEKKGRIEEEKKRTNENRRREEETKRKRER